MGRPRCYLPLRYRCEQAVHLPRAFWADPLHSRSPLFCCRLLCHPLLMRRSCCFPDYLDATSFSGARNLCVHRRRNHSALLPLMGALPNDGTKITLNALLAIRLANRTVVFRSCTEGAVKTRTLCQIQQVPTGCGNAPSRRNTVQTGWDAVPCWRAPANRWNSEHERLIYGRLAAAPNAEPGVLERGPGRLLPARDRNGT